MEPGSLGRVWVVTPVFPRAVDEDTPLRPQAWLLACPWEQTERPRSHHLMRGDQCQAASQDVVLRFQP